MNAVSRKRQEPLDVPLADMSHIGVDEDREVEVVGDECPGISGLQDVEPLHDQDVRTHQDPHLVGHDVIGDVGIDRCLEMVLAGLGPGHEVEEPTSVEALGEAFALHEALLLEDSIREEKAIRGHQFDPGMMRPPGQQLLENA